MNQVKSSACACAYSGASQKFSDRQTNQSHITVPSEAVFLSIMKVSLRAYQTDTVHADNGSGECKHLITDYLKCLRSRRGTNDDECRKLAKGYLGCRMDKYVTGQSHSRCDVRGRMGARWPSIVVKPGCRIWLIAGFSRNLMAPDNFKNLGLEFNEKGENGGQSNGSGKKGESKS